MARNGPVSEQNDERNPLLRRSEEGEPKRTKKRWRSIPARISSIILGAVKAVVNWVVTPGRYLVACFLDQDGRFSLFLPFVAIGRKLVPKSRRNTSKAEGIAGTASTNEAKSHSEIDTAHLSNYEKALLSTDDSNGASVHEDGSIRASIDNAYQFEYSKARATRYRKGKPSSKTNAEDTIPTRRSVRIKFQSENDFTEESRTNNYTNVGSSEEVDAKELVAASLKSPSGLSAAKVTRFPQAPLPPRPLVLRRQPSYSKILYIGPPPQKTLVIDLDETLIHSHSRGGRFATGHMVEVKMSHAVGVNGITIAPQVPILYYVHKRPHCDEFLRKISKWFRLVIFTASVQEYADPVIDWLEMERPYFAARYYRQHCTMRNGAYIKDLSQVEADLSKVMILDNSPVSYIFHEDNAIPIEGWISDPTDNDLLHLIPLLEGLQYLTDVRTLLALRLGQPNIDAGP